VFLAAIMIMSVFAVGIGGLAGTAAAETGDLTDGTAENVTAGFGDSEQDVTFEIDLDNGDSDTISVDFSAAGEAGAVVEDYDIADDADYTISADSLEDGILTFDITADAELDGKEISITFEHDLSDVEGPISDVSVVISSEEGGDETTAEFDVFSASDVSIAEPLISDNLDSVEFTVEHSELSTDDEVSIFVTDGDDNDVADQEADPSGESTTFTLDLSDNDVATEEGDEFTVHIIAAADSDGAAGTFQASGDDTQRVSTFTVGDEPDAGPIAQGDWGDDVLYVGQIASVDTDRTVGSSIQVREVTARDGGSPSSSTLARSVTVGSGGIIVIDTDRLRGEGDYILRDNAGNWLDSSGDWVTGISNAQDAEVLEQDLSVEFDEDEVDNTETVDLNVESLRSSFVLEITGELDGSTLDYETLEEIFGGNDGFEVVDEDDDIVAVDAADDDSFEADFDDQDGGEYEFAFDVADTTASDSDSITVNDVGDAELTVEDVEQQTGDIAAITVGQTAADSGTLVIGDIDDVGYQANVSIDFGDRDEVTVYFNTYAAGNESLGDVVWLDDDDLDDDAEITDFSQTLDIDGILDTGDYELTVSPSADPAETLENPDDVASLFIEERSTDDLNIWTASDDAVEDILDEDDDEQVAAVLEAIENDLVTPTDAVAHDDFAVHQLEASGLKGLFKWAEAETGEDALGDQFIELATNSTFENEDGDSAIQLRVRETRDSVGPNAQRGVVDLAETGVVILHDDENEQYFILMDTSEIVLENGDSLESDDDYEFDVKFELRDERLLDVDTEEDDLEDAYERLDTAFEVVERAGSFDLSDDDLIEVEASDDAEITGETNIAPGSEVSIRVRGQGDARFSKSVSDIVVDTDGTFAGVFDFSDRNVDDEFRATLRDAGIDDRPQEDGIVVESVAEEPADDADDADDDADDVVDDTDDAVDDTEDATDDTADDTTDDETPGFGALVALIALLGAALLAARRQN